MADAKVNKMELKQKIRLFVDLWSNPNCQDEKQDTQKFWMSLLRDVLGVERPDEIIDFERPVKLGHTSFIDAYINPTKILIEQKSGNKSLVDAAAQSDGTMLTPFGQAKRYADELPFSQKPRYIVTCNFHTFLIYDMENPKEEPQKILLEDLPKEYTRLQFLAENDDSSRDAPLQKELEVSIKAGELVGKIYKAFSEEFAKVRGPETTPETLTKEDLHSLNVLCVRLVFCLYAEDSGIFNKDQFYHFMKSFRPENMRGGLKDLFKILDTKPADRDPFLEEKFKAFPYVNGNLFAEQHGEAIPTITEATANILLEQASLGFDWSEISPTIFGAVFESTLNPETRRTGGMHYTSIENIHKVIDPLFLDARKAELTEIKSVKNTKERNTKLQEFRKSLGEDTFFDPACGSGNFLTETYISLRNLENEALAEQHNGEAVLDVMGDEIFVNIHQFYGIEINDFAATVAKTALWIAECQMMQKTAEILHRNLEFLPLKSYGNITVGNALQIDWSSLCGGGIPLAPAGEPSSATPTAGPQTPAPQHPAFDYIIGNPPFVGFTFETTEQKADMEKLFPGTKNLDFVCGWYKKASDYMEHYPKTKAALVSTNSITQGETVPRFWPNLKVKIDFAYRTFRWDSESNSKAHVHCVIIGFSSQNVIPGSGREANSPKRIYLNDHDIIEVKNINAYLMDGPDVFVDSRTKPLCKVPSMIYGNKPTDGGNLIIEADEYESFVKKEPAAAKWIKPLTGATEYLYNKKRYCLWLVGATPADLRSMPTVMERIKKVKELRQATVDKASAEGKISTVKTVQKLVEIPHLFAQRTQPEKKSFIVVPEVSSEKRFYIPIAFMSGDVKCTNLVKIIPSATLFHFGVLTSSVHMAWMRAVCGRLKSDYRYSKDVVYNNFPWPVDCFADARNDVKENARNDVKENARNDVKENARNDVGKNARNDVKENARNDVGKNARNDVKENARNDVKENARNDVKENARNDVKENARNDVKEKIEKTAQAILDARALYPDCSLADLYDETTMPIELRKAHQANDAAVMAAYGFNKNMTESEIVAELLKMYQQLVSGKSEN